MMEHKKFLVVFLSLFFATFSSWATTYIMSEKNYWQCSAYDGEKKQWTVISEYERASANKALEACKKESANPTSCKIEKELCHFVVHGKSTHSMWQCTALDGLAKHWRSNYYPQPDDAALGAKDFCRQQSPAPESCYVNLLTCTNINERI